MSMPTAKLSGSGEYSMIQASQHVESMSGMQWNTYAGHSFAGKSFALAGRVLRSTCPQVLRATPLRESVFFPESGAPDEK